MAYHKSPRRSRSPAKTSDSRKRRHRSHSPHQHDHHHSSSHRLSHPKPPVVLPFQASPLRKDDFPVYKPLFALYLDIQKQLVMEELSEDEIKGRWKSFVGRWNRGELAEGWYEPHTFRRAQASTASAARTAAKNQTQDFASGDLSDDEVGPALPGGGIASYTKGERHGPAIPSLQDLELQREAAQEESLGQREDLRHDRRLDRKEQKERLDELVPPAEAGSKDRLLEKKREKADNNNRTFASAKTDGDGVVDVPEADLLGDDEGGIEGLKKQKREMERKKNEREIRREEMMRARQQEREQRLKEYKAREEKTMSGLIALAKAKFG